AARLLLGEPNADLSKSKELRFGTHGSVAVDLEHGTFYDHENTVGGGGLDLIVHIKGGTRVDAVQWLKQQGILVEGPKPNGKGCADRAKPEQITVAEFFYHDESGDVVFAVERQEFRNPDGTPVLKDGKGKKTFKQKRPDPDRPGGWINNVDGCPV